MQSTFHCYLFLILDGASIDDTLNRILLRVPKRLGWSFIGVSDTNLWFFLNVFVGDVHIFILLGDADDEVPDVIG